MNILVLGGTRFFGKHLINSLLEGGNQVTIATRGRAKDEFSNHVSRLIVERTDPVSLKQAIANRHFDVIYDNLAYCSDDVKYLLDVADCGHYIMTSSAAVYENGLGVKEEEFNPLKKPLNWCDRSCFPYDEGKRQAECALFQYYKGFPSTAVRYPYVIGSDDYTKRLFFYVEHVMKEIPMFIDNPDGELSFVRMDEAGEFLAFLSDQSYCGAVNGGSPQTISAGEILAYITKMTGKTAILSKDGEQAPFNGGAGMSLNIEKAKKLGFTFTPLEEWIYPLIDSYITKLRSC